MAKISAPWFNAVRTTERTAGFILCASPPLVITASRRGALGSAIYAPLLEVNWSTHNWSRSTLSALRDRRPHLAFHDAQDVVVERFAWIEPGDPGGRLGRREGGQQLLQLDTFRVLRHVERQCGVDGGEQELGVVA